MKTYTTVPGHIYGPAVVRRSDTGGASLVDNCPTVESAERIAAALNECHTGALEWALPAVTALEDIEKERVIRALAKELRHHG